ncbi:hypothetical protein [Melaminivora sp.]|uniref:hypothetical protein n=1 Tax=Melaminivora sp. TaxID=1933032 RepID=UPI0028A938A1|nr:hypothetical protein [Melaminivora sp.]
MTTMNSVLPVYDRPLAGRHVRFGPVQHAAHLLRQGAQAWRSARRRASHDQDAWNAALHDARLMADLSRAMNGIAVDDMRRYRF